MSNSQPVSSANQPIAGHLEYRPDIDGLRAFAVLAVLIFHAFPEALPGGFVGVDLFFVISGYLISSIIFLQLRTGSFTIAKFYERRIRRIFPSLAVVLLVCLIAGFYLLLADEYQQLAAHTAAGAGFVANLLSWSEASYFDKAADTKPLLHLWSLGIEEQFYILWPLLVAWFLKPNLQKYFKWLFIVLIVASFVVNLWSLVHAPVALYYSPFSRFWELLAGAGLAYASSQQAGSFQIHSIKISHYLSFAAFIAYVLALCFINQTTAFPGWWALLPVMAAVGWIAAGPKAWFNRYVLANKAVVAVGLISYPLYLWHWPLLAFLRLIEGQAVGVGPRLVALVLAFILAYLSSRLIEKPLRYGQYGLLKTFGLAGFVAVLGMVGFWIVGQQGLPNRPHIQNYQNPEAALNRTQEQDLVCQDYVAKMGENIYYCRLNSVKSTKTVAVIGDSHAHVAYPGIAELSASRQMNTVLLANNSCPPFMGAEMGDTPEDKAICRRNIEQLLKVVESKPDIQTVFVFSRGAKYFTGIGFGPAEASEARAPFIAQELFFKGLEATVQRLQKAGKKVYYISENPEIGISPMACVTRPLRSEPLNCELNKQQVLERQKTYLLELAKLKNINIINSLDVFCPDQKCVINDNGKILYADDDHLSVEGSRYQAQHLLQSFIP